jgi:hypothetical protein
MGSKRNDKIEGIAGKSITGKAGLPGEEDVEAHKWKAKDAVPGPEEIGGGRSKGVVPTDEDDVEAHKWKAKEAVPGPEEIGGGRSKGVVPTDEDDVEAHKWKAKDAVPGPEEIGGGRSKGVVPTEDDDVEGHRFTAKGIVEGRPGGELTNRKLPHDSPHGESYIGRNKG